MFQVLYEWDSPDLHSPVKSRSSQAPSVQNVIYLFTKIPTSDQEVTRFLRPKSDKVTSKDIFQELVAKSKSVMGMLKGDVPVQLNLVDTSCLFGQTDMNNNIKDEFVKSLRNLKFASMESYAKLLQVCQVSSASKSLSDWFVPKSKPFQSYTKELRTRADLAKNRSMRLLQRAKPAEAVRAYSVNKLDRRFSDESVASHGSRKSLEAPLPQSRGQELRRRSNLNQLEQTRRHQSERAERAEAARREWVEQKRGHVAVIEKGLSHEDSDKLTKSLMLMHSDACKNDKDNMYLVALAEVVVSWLLKHQTHLNSLGLMGSFSFESVLEKLFLASPEVIASRKYRGNPRGKITDNKLQVLYLIEAHWFLACQTKQSEYVNKMLLHLRKISIWDCPSEMTTFLHKVVMPNHLDRQPDIMCTLFDELNVTKPDELQTLFSPSKASVCSGYSTAPTSVKSSASEAPKWACLGGGGGDDEVVNLVSQSKQAKLDKLKRRMLGSENPNLKRVPTINLRSKREDKVRPITASRIKLKRIPRRSSTRKSTQKTKTSSSLNRLHSAKRNLCFDIAVRRTPRKLLPEAKTPEKKATEGNKVLAQETPVAKKRRKKSDGTTIIDESPEKVGETQTPRSKKARQSLKRKMFYQMADQSQATSRNILRSEESMHMEHFLSQSLNLADANRRVNEKRMSLGSLFPHLLADNVHPRSPEAAPGLGSSTTFNLFATPTKTRAGRPGETPIKSDRKVAFNTTPQPKTPRSVTKTEPRSILKTPSKDLESELVRSRACLFTSPAKTAAAPPTLSEEEDLFAEAETEADEAKTEAQDTTPRRTPRMKSLVNRFGIDDVKLSHVISPVSESRRRPRSQATPPSRPQSSFEVTSPEPKKEPEIKVFLDQDVSIGMISDLTKAKKSDGNKEWAVSQLEMDSPSGGPRLRLSLCSPQRSSQVHQRFSRSVAAEIGISPRR